MSNLKWIRHAGTYNAEAGRYWLTICRGHNSYVGDHWAWRVWSGTSVVASGTATLLSTAKAMVVEALGDAQLREVPHV